MLRGDSNCNVFFRTFGEGGSSFDTDRLGVLFQMLGDPIKLEWRIFFSLGVDGGAGSRLALAIRPARGVVSPLRLTRPGVGRLDFRLVTGVFILPICKCDSSRRSFLTRSGGLNCTT
jgi:hypothetical protein